MMGRLHVDLFLQDRFLLNGVSVNIRLVRSNDAFSLNSRPCSISTKVATSFRTTDRKMAPFYGDMQRAAVAFYVATFALSVVCRSECPRCVVVPELR